MSKLIHAFSMEKSFPINWATLVIKKLPKENYRPIGENWPNLVTLIEISI
jgi:hypothetical protein